MSSPDFSLFIATTPTEERKKFLWLLLGDLKVCWGMAFGDFTRLGQVLWQSRTPVLGAWLISGRQECQAASQKPCIS